MAAGRSHSRLGMWGSAPRLSGTDTCVRKGECMKPATTEKLVELDQAFEAARERELRGFVRRDGASVRRTPETDGEPGANNIGTLFERMAGTSMQEIDDLIAGLQTLRSLIQD